MSIQTGQPSSTMVLASERRSLVAYLDLSALNGIVDRARIETGGYVTIADQVGNVIAHQDPKAVQEQWNIRSHPAVALALEGRDGSFREGGGGGSDLASVARVPSSDALSTAEIATSRYVWSRSVGT